MGIGREKVMKGRGVYVESEIYAATMSCCWVFWGSGVKASMERWLVMELNSKVSTSSP